MERAALTIVIISHRSDDLFLQALESAQFADEILIVDHNSQNDWGTLAGKYAFSIMTWSEPITDYAALRNAALQRVRTPWVFFLDSDEVITPNAVFEIEELLQHGLAKGYRIIRTDSFLGKELRYGETGSIRLLRFAQTDSLRFDGTVHERGIVTGIVKESEIIIHHRPHQSVSSFLQKISRYAKMAAKERPASGLRNILELLVFPPAKFIDNVVLKLGFLDGWRGLVYAWMMSLHSLFVRIYRYELHHEQK